MYSSLPILLMIFAVSVGIFNCQLVVYPAGANEFLLGDSTGLPLSNGASFCPEKISAKGFNILCVSDGNSRKADFYVNGERLFRDQRTPYFMVRNKRNGRIKKWVDWKDFEGSLVIKCVQRRGKRRITSITEVNVTVSCRDEELVTAPSEDEPVKDVSFPQFLIHKAGLKGQEGIVLVDGVNICPVLAFPYGEFSIECVGPKSTRKADFFVEDILVKTEFNAPFFIAGDSLKEINTWHSYPRDGPFQLSCKLVDRISKEKSSRSVMISFECTKEEKSLATGVKTDPSGCVEIDTRFARLSQGWEEIDGGLIFRRDDTSTGFAGAGAYPLVYHFTAPLTTKYGFVVETTTPHRTDHNDIYAKFEGIGFQLMRDGVLDDDPENPDGFGWLKVYQNSAGKSRVSSSVDFKPHSIATREALQKGMEYTVKLSGRSSMVEVHRIFLFPCEASTCYRGSKTWNINLKMCVELTAA